MSRQVEDFENLREEKFFKKKEAGFPFSNKYSCQEGTAIPPNHFQPCSNPERERKEKEKKITVVGIISPLTSATCERSAGYY